MASKLVLNIDSQVLKAARLYAKTMGISVSVLVENYLKTLVVLNKEKEELSPRVRRLLGSIALPENFNYKEALGEIIVRKYKK